MLTCFRSLDELTPECLGHAGEVYEHILGEEKYTFVEHVKNPRSCTILLKGPSDHAIAQMKDALRDGLRAVKNTIEDGALIPGAGSFEVRKGPHPFLPLPSSLLPPPFHSCGGSVSCFPCPAASGCQKNSAESVAGSCPFSLQVGACQHLLTVTRKKAEGRVKLGVEAFAEALLGVPKTLAENAGYDPQEAVIAVQVTTDPRLPPLVQSKAFFCILCTKWFPSSPLTKAPCAVRCSSQAEHESGSAAGIDVTTGEPMDPTATGVYDNYIVKKQIIQSAPVIASQLLLVDEVMRAGMNMRKR